MPRSTANAPIDRTPLPLACLLGAFVFFSTFSIAGSQTALGLTAAVWLAYVVRGKAPRLRRTSLDLPIIIFIAVALVSAVLSDEKLASLRNLRNLVLFGALYVVGMLLTEAKLGRRLFAVLVFSGTGSAVYGIALYLLGRGDGVLGRTHGSFSTPMTFGGILLILCSLFVSVSLARGIGTRVRLVLCLATVIAFTALLFTFTRSSWIGTLVSVVVILSLLRKRLLIPFAAALVILFLLLPATYRERVATMWSPTFGTNVQRLEMLSASWKMIKDHPIIGVGARDLAELYRQYKPPSAVHIHGHMHNNFLQVTVQMGVVGLAAFLYLLCACLLLLVRTLRRPLPAPERSWVVGSIGAFVGFLVNGLFDWNFGDAEIITLLFIVVGANVAMSMHATGFDSSSGDDRTARHR